MGLKKDLLNIDNYDYKLTGALFNGLKLKDQLTFLERWYPIGVQQILINEI